MPRYELPRDLSPEEERAVLAALEHTLTPTLQPPAAWALAGRAEALRLGALHVRHQAERPWDPRAQVTFARRGTQPLVGRGDAK